MIEYCEKRAMREYIDAYNYRYEKIKITIDEIENHDFRKLYLDTVNSNLKTIYAGWWSEILTAEELMKYV